MFYNATNFNQNISAWDVGAVTAMQRMFFYSNFNSTINGWDVGSVANMEFMFASANVIRYNETTMFNDTQMDPNDYRMNSCPTNYVVSTALTNTAIIIAF